MVLKGKYYYTMRNKTFHKSCPNPMAGWWFGVRSSGKCFSGTWKLTLYQMGVNPFFSAPWVSYVLKKTYS